MSGYVPNNRNERTPPPSSPYNGDFNTQPARSIEGISSSNQTSLVGIRFIWDNGECLGANIPYNLIPAGGAALRGGLNAQGCIAQNISGREYEAQLFADADVDSDVATARGELQNVLDEIIAAELAEAAELQAIQDQRSSAMNALHKGLAFGKGLFMAGVGMVDSAVQFNDLINPHTQLSNALRSAWNADATNGRWIDSFLQNYGNEQHRELVEALGFDPASVTREQLAQAYEIANFIYDDAPSQAILGRFAIDYARAQNAEELAELSGGAAFEIVLTAVLAVLTGGVFLAVKAATSLRHLGLLKRLGNALTRLGAALRRVKIKTGSRAKGNGTGAQTVEVRRPEGVEAKPLPVIDEPSTAQPKTREEQLKENKKRGEEFATAKTDEFRSTADNVETEITIKAADGTKTRVDAIGIDKETKAISIQEYKSSETAPLTKNQEAAFPQIEEGGGEIVGKGKGIFTGGTKVPPTTIQIIRPPEG
ncbi:hypothetical protein [Pseudomonas sp.]|uniref:hypothetical protein n=1 Tax=Pseudomonas sp. TaxID=306 RepID=UPI003D146980